MIKTTSQISEKKWTNWGWMGSVEFTFHKFPMNQDSRVKNEILLQQFSIELFYNTGLFYDLNLEATEGKIDRFNLFKKKFFMAKLMLCI